MTRYLIRRNAGGVAGTVITAADPESFRWPDGETVEVFTDQAKFDARLTELAPPPGPDPVADLLAALGPADTVAKIKGALTTHLPRALGRAR